MFARPGLKKRRIGFVSGAVAVTVVSVVLTRTAFARITVNTVDTLAVVADNGRHLVLTGPIACTPDDRAYLEVTVTTCHGRRGRGPHTHHVQRRGRAVGAPCVDPRR